MFVPLAKGIELTFVSNSSAEPNALWSCSTRHLCFLVTSSLLLSPIVQAAEVIGLEASENGGINLLLVTLSQGNPQLFGHVGMLGG